MSGVQERNLHTNMATEKVRITTFYHVLINDSILAKTNQFRTCYQKHTLLPCFVSATLTTAFLFLSSGFRYTKVFTVIKT
jgi:hypothetical protein